MSFAFKRSLNIAGLVFVASCGSAQRDVPVVATDAPHAAVEVQMQLIAFKPQRVSVEVAQPVQWVQRDAGSHTVTSGTVEQAAGGVQARPDGRFDSGEIATGASFVRSFDQPGLYAYYCVIHPATMRGEIEVVQSEHSHEKQPKEKSSAK